MAAGHPLTDEDRWPWLDTIAAWIDERVAAGEPAVVTCSALKKIYRDKLRRQGVVFVVLLQCLFDRFGSVFPQCGLMVFPGVVIVSR